MTAPPSPYLQIAENRWNAQKRRSETRIICTLRRADDKAKERLKQLAASIRRQASFEEIAQLEPGWQFITGWVHGPFHVISQLWDRLGIRRILEKALHAEDRDVPFERSIFAMVANRCLAPASKFGCYESRLREEVYFPEERSMALHHLYRAMDFLSAHKEEIYWQPADLLNLDVDLIFYDTTSLYFECDEEDRGENALRLRCHSKDGRADAPQVVVGLAVTRDGIPVRRGVFPGNTQHVTTTERVKEDLRSWRLNRCLWVIDAGMASKDGRLRINKAAIGEAGKRDGLRVIRTNDEGLDSEDLALAYKQLMRVEEGWKTMKSGTRDRARLPPPPGADPGAHLPLCPRWPGWYPNSSRSEMGAYGGPHDLRWLR